MNKLTRLLIGVGCMLWMVPALCAQQEETPLAAEEERTVESAGGGLQAPPEGTPKALIPDTRPLSGVEDFEVETAGRSRNFVVPSLRLSAFGDSNRAILDSGERGIEMRGSIVGNLAVHRVSRRNDFALDYVGGGLINARNSDLNGMIHQMGFTESYVGRRWGITLGDHLSYLPESSFGFSGFGPSIGYGGGFGGGLANWNPAFSGAQSLFTGRGNRLANSALAQLQYIASSRSSFTLSGSYGLLRFMESEGIESDFGMASAGYNYALSRRDTIAVSYGFAAFRFKGSDFHLDNHFVNLLYGRRLTGRMAFELSGGPQFTVSRSPLFGSENRVSWNAHSSLSYQLSRTSLHLSYSHYTSAGSGLLFGASTDRVRGSVGRQLTRHWYWSIGPGYSRNARLSQSPTVGTVSTYHSIYAMTGLHRELGRYTDLSLSYSSHNQWSDAINPSGINSGRSYLRHHFGVSLTWHTPRIAMN
jgi:hypothetical protein